MSNTKIDIMTLIRKIVCKDCIHPNDDPLQSMATILDRRQNLPPADKARLWYLLSKLSFEKLANIDIYREVISASTFLYTLRKVYPSLDDIKIPDRVFQITTIEDMQRILTLDWTNLVPYLAEFDDCDDSCIRLYQHLVDWYQIHSAFPVWGEATVSHGFNAGVFRAGNELVARIIEPQTDEIFEHTNAAGVNYIPKETARYLITIKKKGD